MPQRWFCWGANSHGQLGLGDDVDRLVPTSVSLENIVTICAGGGHTIGLSTLNSYAWGWNEDGQLGFESHQQSVATPNDSLGPFTFAGCGWSHTIAVDSIGDVYVWGDNQFGQIGTEDIGRKPKRKIAVKTRTKKYNEIAHNTAWIKHFEKDCRRSMWLKMKEDFFGMGDNKFSQLGLPPEIKEQPTITQIESMNPHQLRSVSCGYRHSACKDADGSVVMFGSNQYGQLGTPSVQQFNFLKGELIGEIKKVVCCWNTTLFISVEGKVYGIGRNHLGQIGGGDRVDRYSPHLIHHPFGNIVDISCGSEHVLCLTEDGKLVGWGWGEHGQLGLGHTEDTVIPTEIEIPGATRVDYIACGGGHSFARATCKE